MLLKYQPKQRKKILPLSLENINGDTTGMKIRIFFDIGV